MFMLRMLREFGVANGDEMDDGCAAALLENRKTQATLFEVARRVEWLDNDFHGLKKRVRDQYEAALAAQIAALAAQLTQPKTDST